MLNLLDSNISGFTVLQDNHKKNVKRENRGPIPVDSEYKPIVYMFIALSFVPQCRSRNEKFPRIKWSVYLSGGTEEYGEMIDRVQELYSETTILAVGFSMGGNIVTKYLGERLGANQGKVMCGISCCQGYDAER